MRPTPLLAAALIALAACGGGGAQPPVVLPAPPPPVLPPPPPPAGEWPEPPLAEPTSPITTVARITELPSRVVRMAPCVVHVHAAASTIAAGGFHTARYRWLVAGPVDWRPLQASDPRAGVQLGEPIALDRDCEGFNFALFADVPGRYTIGLEVWDEAGAVAVARSYFEISDDTRTKLHVAAAGSDITGDGSVARPWRTTGRAWSFVLDNGRSGYSILLNRGDTFGGFANGSGLSTGVSQVVVGAYGTGPDPILQFATNYADDGLLTLRASEAVLIRDLNFRGSDAIAMSGYGIVLNDACLNVSFVGVSFGGPSDTDGLAYGVLSNANNPRDAVPAHQGRGYAFFGCAGHTSAYFLFADAPDTKSSIVTTDFAATTTQFECAPSQLSTLDGAYDGMEVTVTGGASRNLRRVVKSYVARGANGRPRFTVTSPFPAAVSGVAYVVDIDRVGDSDIFLFGVENHATANKGTEARVRVINGRRVTLVGVGVDASTTAPSQKDAFRLMVDFAYVYRCAVRNTAMGGGAEIGSEGIGPFDYVVFDRCYGQSLQGSGGSFAETFTRHSMVRACVFHGDLLNTANDDGFMHGLSEVANTGGRDHRVTHCTFFAKRVRESIRGNVNAVSGWDDVFFTFENNLVARGFSGTHMILADTVTPGGFASASGNVYTPPQTDEGGSQYPVFRIQSGTYTLAQWNTQPRVGGEAFGTISPDTLVASDFIPDEVTHVVETTNRTFTSKGVYQDYYGNDPRGSRWSGAVALDPR